MRKCVKITQFGKLDILGSTKVTRTMQRRQDWQSEKLVN